MTIQNGVKLSLCITVYKGLDDLAPTISQTCIINVTLGIEPEVLPDNALPYQTLALCYQSLQIVVHSSTISCQASILKVFKAAAHKHFMS